MYFKLGSKDIKHSTGFIILIRILNDLDNELEAIKVKLLSGDSVILLCFKHIFQNPQTFFRISIVDTILSPQHIACGNKTTM